MMPAVFVLIWSTGFVVARFAMPHSPPFSFLAVRYSLSVACFGIWILLFRAAWPKEGRQFIHLGISGVLMHAGYLGGVWLAVKSGMGAGLASLIVGIQPVLTAVWLALAGGNQGVSSRQWIGLLLGFVGLVMVVSRKFTSGLPGDAVTWFNLTSAVVALLSITAGTLYQKHFVKPGDVRTANFVQLVSALGVTLPFALFEDETMKWNTELIGAMAWSVMVLTLGGSSLLYVLIQRGAAASVASLMYLVPPATAAIAWAIFDEPVTALTVVGTVITALGVGMVVRSQPTRQTVVERPTPSRASGGCKSD